MSNSCHPPTPAADAPARHAGCNYYHGNVIELGADNNVGLLIRQVHILLHRVIDLRTTQLGLTANQWRPLILVAYKGIDTPAELSRAMDVDTGAVTRMLDRLVSKGFLQRKRVPEDRRVVKVVLTAQGKAATAQILPMIADTLNTHLQGFSETEIQTLLALLKRMITNAESCLQHTASHQTE